jgi:hypothetical protein
MVGDDYGLPFALDLEAEVDVFASIFKGLVEAVEL